MTRLSTEMIEKLYTISEVSKLLRFSERTIRNLIVAGKIRKSLRISPKGKVLVPSSAITKFIKNKTDTFNNDSNKVGKL